MQGNLFDLRFQFLVWFKTSVTLKLSDSKYLYNIISELNFFYGARWNKEPLQGHADALAHRVQGL